jgi:hypothetical protein
MNDVSFPRKREPSVFSTKPLDPRFRGDDTERLRRERTECCVSKPS